MPSNDKFALQLYKTSAVLSTRELRQFERAERTIAKGLKSFLEVGMALKEIRDSRLYRQLYATFEEYCVSRWELSRPRAYELCAASEVVSDLSAIADIRLLPENEAQARPLTRLKALKHRKRAWLLALKTAKAERRVVTAKDVEAAVIKLDCENAKIPVNGVPVFDPMRGLRAAYADPPYAEQARRRYGCPEVDHKELITRLETFDTWALSLSSTTLRQVLPMCPAGVRVGAWVKPWAVFRPNVNPAFAWEPVIFKIARGRTRQQPTTRDWVSANATARRGLCGVKPDAFCFWIFETLNLVGGDEFYDLYEGTGAVTRAFRLWVRLRTLIPTPQGNKPAGAKHRRTMAPGD